MKKLRGNMTINHTEKIKAIVATLLENWPSTCPEFLNDPKLKDMKSLWLLGYLSGLEKILILFQGEI
jgi:hypothetical protein